MSSGGLRAGSGRPPGRPKGSRDRLPRRRNKPQTPEQLERRAFLDYVHQVVSSGKAAQILAEFLDSPDDNRRAWALQFAVSHDLGTPAPRQTASETERRGLELQRFLHELATRRSIPTQIVNRPQLEAPPNGDEEQTATKGETDA
jgi:hypothetical protein